jgi:HK97 family phage major capsid protein
MEMKDIFKEHADAVEKRLDELGLNTTEIKARLNEVEQKAARRGGGDTPFETKSWGQQVAEANELKEFAEFSARRIRPGRVGFELKTTITTDAASAGPLGGPYRDQPTTMPQQRLRVRDLLPVVNITVGSVEYPRQTTRTNNANTVAEATAKPESAYAFELETVTPKVIAHWVPASRQILEDVPQLQGIIDTELRYGLALKEDAQLLAGDGTGENLDGLIPNATAYAAPFTPAGTVTMIDMVALGLLQAALANFNPSGVVVHSSDWMRMRLLKDADGKYILGDPGAQIEPRLFGKAVVDTPSMTIDKFLVGDFQAAATIYDRWQPRVEISTEHADYFVKNLVAILAEQRLALAVKQPSALVYGDFGNVA